jgi:hypothetical protein
MKTLLVDSLETWLGKNHPLYTRPTRQPLRGSCGANVCTRQRGRFVSGQPGLKTETGCPELNRELTWFMGPEIYKPGQDRVLQNR